MDENLIASADKAIKNFEKLGNVELLFTYTALSKLIGINKTRVTTVEQLRREINHNNVNMKKGKFLQQIKELYTNGILDMEPVGHKYKFLLKDIDTLEKDTKREWVFEE